MHGMCLGTHTYIQKSVFQTNALKTDELPKMHKKEQYLNRCRVTHILKSQLSKALSLFNDSSEEREKRTVMQNV